MSEFITPLKKVRGLGSAKNGVHHWLAQRFTAVINIISVLWVLCMITQVTEFDYNSAYAYIASPFNAVMGLIFVIFGFYHAKLGLQIVIEDYIHCKCVKIASLLAMNGVVFICIIASVFCILRIAL